MKIDIKNKFGGVASKPGWQAARDESIRKRTNMQLRVFAGQALPSAKRSILSLLNGKETTPIKMTAFIPRLREVLSQQGYSHISDYPRLTIAGLEKDLAEIQQTDDPLIYQLRFLGEKLVKGQEFRFAYSDDKLIIGTRQEVEEGVENGALAYKKTLLNIEAISSHPKYSLKASNEKAMMLWSQGNSKIIQRDYLWKSIETLLAEMDYDLALFLILCCRKPAHIRKNIDRLRIFYNMLPADKIDAEIIKTEKEIELISGENIFVPSHAVFGKLVRDVDSIIIRRMVGRYFIEAIRQGEITVYQAVNIMRYIGKPDVIAEIIGAMVDCQAKEEIERIIRIGYQNVSLRDVYAEAIDILQKSKPKAVCNSREYESGGVLFMETGSVFSWEKIKQRLFAWPDKDMDLSQKRRMDKEIGAMLEKVENNLDPSAKTIINCLISEKKKKNTAYLLLRELIIINGMWRGGGLDEYSLTRINDMLNEVGLEMERVGETPLVRKIEDNPCPPARIENPANGRHLPVKYQPGKYISKSDDGQWEYAYLREKIEELIWKGDYVIAARLGISGRSFREIWFGIIRELPTYECVGLMLKGLDPLELEFMLSDAYRNREIDDGVGFTLARALLYLRDSTKGRANVFHQLMLNDALLESRQAAYWLLLEGAIMGYGSGIMSCEKVSDEYQNILMERSQLNVDYYDPKTFIKTGQFRRIDPPSQTLDDQIDYFKEIASRERDEEERLEAAKVLLKLGYDYSYSNRRVRNICRLAECCELLRNGDSSVKEELLEMATTWNSEIAKKEFIAICLKQNDIKGIIKLSRYGIMSDYEKREIYMRLGCKGEPLDILLAATDWSSGIAYELIEYDKPSMAEAEDPSGPFSIEGPVGYSYRIAFKERLDKFKDLAGLGFPDAARYGYLSIVEVNIYFKKWQIPSFEVRKDACLELLKMGQVDDVISILLSDRRITASEQVKIWKMIADYGSRDQAERSLPVFFVKEESFCGRERAEILGKLFDLGYALHKNMIEAVKNYYVPLDLKMRVCQELVKIGCYEESKKALMLISKKRSLNETIRRKACDQLMSMGCVNDANHGYLLLLNEKDPKLLKERIYSARRLISNGFEYKKRIRDVMMARSDNVALPFKIIKYEEMERKGQIESAQEGYSEIVNLIGITEETMRYYEVFVKNRNVGALVDFMSRYFKQFRNESKDQYSTHQSVDEAGKAFLLKIIEGLKQMGYSNEVVEILMKALDYSVNISEHECYNPYDGINMGGTETEVEYNKSDAERVQAWLTIYKLGEKELAVHGLLQWITANNKIVTASNKTALIDAVNGLLSFDRESFLSVKGRYKLNLINLLNQAYLDNNYNSNWKNRKAIIEIISYIDTLIKPL